MNIDWPTFNEIVAFVSEQMRTNQWFQTVGFFGVLTAIWQYTKGGPKYIWDRVKRRITYTANVEETDEFYVYFENWLNKNHRKSYRNIQVTSERAKVRSSYSPSYNEKEDSNKTKKLDDRLVFKQYQDLFFIRRGIFIIRVFKGREKFENANNLNNAFYNNFKISGLFAKRAINKLLQEVLELKIKTEKEALRTKVKVYTNSGSMWESEVDFSPKDLSRIIFEEKDEVVNDLKEFLESESWYERRSIPYKRGYQFFGPAGTGKTSFALALAKHFRKNAYVLNPSGVTDEELRNLFRELSSESVLLIEDIDSVFSKTRDKKDLNIKFNFSTLLNCLDGVFSKHGVITIFTTNHPEQLDSALVREGRIDRHIYMGLPKPAQINEYISLFYEQDLDINYTGSNEVLSIAKVQEFCLQHKNNPTKTIAKIKELLTHGTQIQIPTGGVTRGASEEQASVVFPSNILS